MIMSSSDIAFYNLRTTGTTGQAHVTRIQEVTPTRGGEPFLGCTLVALLGPIEKPQQRYYDCKVTGKNAEQLIRKCKEACDAGRKIMVEFKLGDSWIKPFRYRSGAKRGQPGSSEKAELLEIYSIEIDGKLKYQADPNQDEDEDEPPVPSPAANANGSAEAEAVAASF